MGILHYPSELEIVPLTSPPTATVSVPGSKSITNRALVLAALASRESPCVLTGMLRSEDTEVMVECLRQLGYQIVVDWDVEIARFDIHGSSRLVPADSAELFVANSGTTVRFLTALVSLSAGTYRLDGVPRMRERPIQDLLDALLQIPGVFTTSDAKTGCPPVTIRSKGWQEEDCRVIHVRADTSSQFVSGLLMAAAFVTMETWVRIDGGVVSESYILMTEAMVRAWGGSILMYGLNGFEQFEVEGKTRGPRPQSYAIEPDASAASYFFAAAAVTGGTITVHGMKRDLLQGDVRFVDVLQQLGCDIRESTAGISVTGRPLRGIDVDMNDISDTVMTLAAVACFAEGPTTIRNVAHIRHKETDRITAIATELRKLGAEVEEYPDGLKITPRPLKGCAVETYNDHRMAMSLALIGLKVPGVIIKNPGCVAKTYPGFWQDFEKLRG